MITFRERGSALIVGLVFLLIMTIIGVTAMQGTTLQERMAGNLRDRTLAFQASEAALRAGETWLLDKANEAAAQGHAELASPLTWDGTGAHGTVAGFTNGGLHSADPVFHISPPRLVRIGISLPPEYRSVYEVTARGVGGSDTAVVVIQSRMDPE